MLRVCLAHHRKRFATARLTVSTHTSIVAVESVVNSEFSQIVVDVRLANKMWIVGVKAPVGSVVNKLLKPLTAV